jgi:hypothetical protein
MNTPDLSAVRWRKSSHSGDTGGDCVEVAGLPGAVAVRDSKNPGGPALVLRHREFRTLLDQVKADALRH